MLFSKEQISKVLSIDFVERKSRKWKLVHEHDWKDYLVERKSRKGCLLTNAHSNHSYRRFNTIQHFLNVEFPGVQDFLERFHGKIALCGGFYSYYMNSESLYDSAMTLSACDVDIFFYNCEENEANRIMTECIRTIVSKVGTDVISIRIERRKYVTTVIVKPSKLKTYWNRKIIKYQFIHRLYPSLDTIIGGFDIGASMVAYDGKDVYATQLGAWTFANKTIIVDISRRSTTFAKRINKYKNRYFSVVFPGIDSDHEFLKDRNIHELVKQLKKQMHKFNLVWRPDIYEGGFIEQFEANPIRKVGDFAFYVTGNYIYLKTRWILDHENPEKYKKKNSDYEGWITSFNNTALANLNLLKNKQEDYIVSIIEVCRMITSDDFINHDRGIKYYFRNYVAPREINPIEKGKALDDYYIKLKGDFMKELQDPNFVIQKYLQSFEDPSIDFELFDDVHNSIIISVGTSRSQYWTSENLDLNRLGDFTFTKPNIFNSSNTKSININGNLVVNEFSGYEYFVKNSKRVQAQFTRNNWMIQDPQRQWTSSIDPSDITVHQFYGLNYSETNDGISVWNGFKIGIPDEVETTIRLIFNKYKVPKNLVFLLMKYITLNSYWEYSI